ncbi:hypothetical protein ABT348_03445 [Streptomyces olivaceus]|jgi:hypothetical protein|uniref:hypothetical protein n=1 Tax=Streptomyces olivaceus TaxID=47716 RepID=UPI0033301616
MNYRTNVRTERRREGSKGGPFTVSLTGQWLVVALFASAIAILSRRQEGTFLWIGSVLGLAAAAGFFVQFDSVANWRRGMLCALALLLGAMFTLQVFIALFTD